MARTVEEMAAKGKRKLEAKKEDMKEMYRAAIDHMIDQFRKLPFGSRIKSRYEKMVRDVAAANYYVDPDKWETNWKRKITM